MATRTYGGSCHCGAVKFEVDLDLARGAGKCNCSSCAKSRFWAAPVKPAQLRILQGEADLSDYQHGRRTVHFHFCKHCGIRPFTRGKLEALGGDYCMVSLSCLDGVDDAELAAAPVRYSDGRHDDWMKAPAVTSHL